MRKVTVRKAMSLCFGNIIAIEEEVARNTSLKTILMRSLKCLVHHSHEIQKNVAKFSGNPFGNIILFKDPHLLNECRGLVSTNATQNVLTVSTGVPPHSKQIKILHSLKNLMNNEIKEREAIFESLKKIITRCSYCINR